MNITHILHQSTVRRAFLLPGILLGLAVASPPAQAATIVPDTWYSAGPAGTPVEGGIEFATNGSGYQSILTYFDSVSLSNVGDSLSVSLTFSAAVGNNSASAEYPLAFAFYNSGGSRISADGLGQNPSVDGARVYNGYRGYRVNMHTASRSGFPLRLSARSTDHSALVNGAAYTTIASGGSSARTLTSDTLYTVAYTFTRTDADTLDITFSMTGGDLGSNYNGSWSVVSTSETFYTDFDTFAITLQGVTTFDSVTLHDVSITVPNPVPEPAAVAVMGISSLVFLACRWRRR